jgi:hypothetical protein
MKEKFSLWWEEVPQIFKDIICLILGHDKVEFNDDCYRCKRCLDFIWKK